jgi:hypothetical protein
VTEGSKKQKCESVPPEVSFIVSLPMHRPQKNMLAYILPFLIIGAIIAGAFYYIQGQNIDFTRLYQVVKTPQASSKVEVAYTKEGVNYLPWGSTEWEVLSPATSLNVGDLVSVGVEGRLVLRFFEGSEVRLDQDSTLSITRLDSDTSKGNHIALELQEGMLWGRVKQGVSENSDFIVTTKSQVLQASQTVVFSISTDPESSHVVGGSLKLSLAEKLGAQRKPLGVFNLNGGEQIVFDAVTKAKLEKKGTKIIEFISDEFVGTQWYLWNDEIEKELGYLVDPSTIEFADKTDDLEIIEDDSVTIASPKSGAVVGTTVTVRGEFDSERVVDIFVNEQKASKSIDGQWDVSLPVSSSKNILTITAMGTDGVERKVAELTLKVQDTGPEELEVTFPLIDENNNAKHDNDDLEILGTVSSTASRICISHNDTAAYCLKAFKEGDSTWRYVAAVKYGNVVDGRNKYAIIAYDKFENINSTTIYIFRNQEKPNKKIEEEVNSTPPPPVETSLTKPIITFPTDTGSHSTTITTVKVRGTVSSSAASILVNNTKIRHDAGAEEFEFDWTLEEGENLIKIKAVDSAGNESKTTLYRVIYTNTSVDESATTAGL